jgi:hypothetical protein
MLLPLVIDALILTIIILLVLSVIAAISFLKIWGLLFSLQCQTYVPSFFSHVPSLQMIIFNLILLGSVGFHNVISDQIDPRPYYLH